MRVSIVVLAFLLSACASYQTTRTPGVTLPAALDPQPQIVHDAPASTTSLLELGRIRVDQNQFGTTSKCEERALAAARKDLGGAVFYVHALDNSTIGLAGPPACEVVAYAKK